MERVLELDRSLEAEHSELDVRFLLDWSSMRSARSEREIYVWSVDNKETAGQYLTEIFVNYKGVLCGTCNCQARTQCKHLNHCLVEYNHFEKKEVANV